MPSATGWASPAHGSATCCCSALVLLPFFCRSGSAESAGPGCVPLQAAPRGRGWAGTFLALIFVPAVFGLLPWHWRWLHVLPIEGVVGRLMVGLLVTYLNIQGAWLVAAVLAGTGLYFASAVSFWVIAENLQNRWIHAVSLHDRWRNWREERAEQKEAERELEPEPVSVQGAPGVPDDRAASKGWEPRKRFFSFFRRKHDEVDPLEEIPAYQRAALHLEQDQVPVSGGMRRT